MTAVTVRPFQMGDTPVVNMVRKARKKALLEPGDTKRLWKGEAAASFVSTGITSSRALPTSSAGYWSPSLPCEKASASEEKRSFGGVFFCLKTSRHSAFQKPSLCQSYSRLPAPRSREPNLDRCPRKPANPLHLLHNAPLLLAFRLFTLRDAGIFEGFVGGHDFHSLP